MIHSFQTKTISAAPDTKAPDGAEVRVLLAVEGGSMAHFQLAPGRVSRAVAHHTVAEIWYFLTGSGQMWRKLDGAEETVLVGEGICLTIPVGTHFQFRSDGAVPLSAIAVTMPPWPGEAEAFFVTGPW